MQSQMPFMCNGLKQKELQKVDDDHGDLQNSHRQNTDLKTYLSIQLGGTIS